MKKPYTPPQIEHILFETENRIMNTEIIGSGVSFFDSMGIKGVDPNLIYGDDEEEK